MTGPKKTPVRVRVISGDQTRDLGKGWWTEYVTVYSFWNAKELSLVTLDNPEVRPPDEIIQACASKGYELTELTNNPKIVLDNGKTVYGCQVWFSSIGENE